jgi:hypothetical protein
MYSYDGLGTRTTTTGASASGCDCLDWRVYGHVCASLAPPGQGESNAWREIPGLRDPAPRPEPAPGDWLPGWALQRRAAPGMCPPARDRDSGLRAAS